jgi:hypothetical protein
MKTRMF